MPMKPKNHIEGYTNEMYHLEIAKMLNTTLEETPNLKTADNRLARTLYHLLKKKKDMFENK